MIKELIYKYLVNKKNQKHQEIELKEDGARAKIQLYSKHFGQCD